MRKIILNKCYGGFGVSEKVYALYAKKKGINIYRYAHHYESGLYVKMNLDEDVNYSTYFFTKDFGNCTKISNADVDKYYFYLSSEDREDPILIEVVEELGEEANGRFADLRVVEIPDNLDYVIDEYDGIEVLHEKVRTW